MELIDLSIIAHASKSSACFTKGCVNMKKKKILQYILALVVPDRFAAFSWLVSFKSCNFTCG